MAGTNYPGGGYPGQYGPSSDAVTGTGYVIAPLGGVTGLGTVTAPVVVATTPRASGGGAGGSRLVRRPGSRPRVEVPPLRLPAVVGVGRTVAPVGEVRGHGLVTLPEQDELTLLGLLEEAA